MDGLLRNGFMFVLVIWCISGVLAQNNDCTDWRALSYQARDAYVECSTGLQNEFGRLVSTCIDENRRWSNAGAASNDLMKRIAFLNATAWERYCDLWTQAIDCIHIEMPDCSKDDMDALLSDRVAAYDWEDFYGIYNVDAIYGFSTRACSGGHLKPELATLAANDDLHLDCMSNKTQEKFTSCFQTVNCELEELEGMDLREFETYEDVHRLSAGSLRCARDVVNSTSCNDVTKTAFGHIARWHLPSYIDGYGINISNASHYNFADTKRCTVGVYGDPHVLLCNTSMITCGGPGDAVYLRNQFVDITGKNEALRGHGHATSITVVRELNITFKAVDDMNVELGSFRVKDGHLHPHFENGQHTIGKDNNIVTMETDGEGSRVFITYPYMGMFVVVGHWGNNYWITVRAAEKVLNDSYGWMIDGCGSAFEIERHQGIDRPQRSLQTSPECLTACENVNQTDFKLNCEFDCTETGNASYAIMTTYAVEDVAKAVSMDVELLKTAKNWEHGVTGGGAYLTISATITIVYLLLFSILFHS